MKILFVSDGDDSETWKRELTRIDPAVELRIWPDSGDPAEIDAALVWKPPHGLLAKLPNLKLIHSLGMGVDFLFADPQLPDVPIARIVDPDMIDQMSEYVCLEVLHHRRNMAVYEKFQQTKRWQQLPLVETTQLRIGILGMGTIGGDTARKLQLLGFPVIGWSRTPKTVPNIERFAGEEGLPVFLAQCDILVCLLPLTPQTENIIDAKLLAQLPDNAYLINCARGKHLVEEDLLAELNNNHLAGASLDVFRTEPLPSEHPFWNHPKVRITPHIAGLTNPRTAAAQIVENCRRVLDGRLPNNLVGRGRGY